MIDLFEADDGATPLTAEECEDLIPIHITLRRELNELEQLGILAAERWAFARRHDVLDEHFLRNLHRRMFGDVWKWAGTFRLTARNIGIDVWQISGELHKLIEDTRYRIHGNAILTEETLTRFHHRLVWIHPFPNGNGRHARLATDLLALQLGKERCTWGRANLAIIGDVRQHYIEALRAADNHDIEPLKAFIYS